MGQYFIPTFLDHAGRITRAINPRDYGSADKLAGHTREGTPLLAAVETLLALDGGSRLVWAGDYADNEPGRDANLYFLIEPHQFVRFEGLIDPEAEIEPNTPRPPVQLGFHTYVCNADPRVFRQAHPAHRRLRAPAKHAARVDCSRSPTPTPPRRGPNCPACSGRNFLARPAPHLEVVGRAIFCLPATGRVGVDVGCGG
jgi:hypothetical protein